MKSAKGKVTVDDRTNLILYSDYPAYINRQGTTCKIGSPTPQVLIEGRIVQLNSECVQGARITWNFDSTSVNNSGVHNTLDLRLTMRLQQLDHGLGLVRFSARPLYNVDIQIQAAEAREGKIVSAPRVLPWTM